MAVRQGSTAGTKALRRSRTVASTGDRVHAAAIGAGVGINLAYWVALFTSESVRTSDDPAWRP